MPGANAPVAPGTVVPTPPEYLTADEVAAILRTSAGSVINWSRDGVRVAGRRVRLAYTSAGRRYLYRPADVERFAADCTKARESVADNHASDREPEFVRDCGAEEAWAALRQPIR